MTIDWLRTSLSTLTKPDVSAQKLVQERADTILRPAGALRELDDVAVWMSGWQQTTTPYVSRPAALVFAADHGVAVTGGVSAYPTDVTAAMLKAYQSGKSTLSAFAKIAGAVVHAIDVGVGRPTNDIQVEAAMSHERFDEAISAGRKAVDDLDADLLVIGEMGIGNTTIAAAIAAALLGDKPSAWVGRGTGVDDDGYTRKLTAVEKAVARVSSLTDPLEILRQVGGAELAAMSGAIIAARMRHLPVLIDGYVVTAAALPLFQVDKSALDHCWVGHCSAEPGHRKVLKHLQKPHLLDLNMRLGEGSGAMAAVPLVAMACAGVVDVPTFGEWFGPQ
jgi:nicotinate-nucleotide--dimethylbenzimidazole phosphoribosyltransferase